MNNNWAPRQPSNMSEHGLGPNAQQLNVRPMGFTHNMSQQRPYAPRNSHPNPQHNSGAPNQHIINQQNHTSGHRMRAPENQLPLPSGSDSIDSSNDYRQQSRPPNQLYRNMDEPIYSTPNVGVSVEPLRSASNLLQTHGIESKTSGVKSPDDTVSSGSCQHLMSELIQKLRNITEKEVETKRLKKQVEEKLKSIDEELKAYEKQMQFRDQLMKLKQQNEKSENQFDIERKKIVALMETKQINENYDKSYLNETIARSHSIKPEVTIKQSESSKVIVSKETVKKSEQNVQRLSDREAVKRPNIPSKLTPVKKIRVEVKQKDISSAVDKEITKLAKSVPKVKEKPVVKPPIISRHTPKPTADQSTKTNRPSRPSLPSSSSVSSGIRTSRPQKMSSSRPSWRTRISDEDTDQQKESTNKSTNVSETSDNSKSKSVGEQSISAQLDPNLELNTESDNEVFSQLSNEVKDTEKVQTKPTSDTTQPSDDKTNKQLHQRINSGQSQTGRKSVSFMINTEANDSHTPMEMDTSTKPDNESNKETIDSNDTEKSKSKPLETHLINDHNYTNIGGKKSVDKDCEVIELDDDDGEDYSTSVDLDLVKKEKTDQNLANIETSNRSANINPNQIIESDREIESNPETTAPTLGQSTATVSGDSEMQSNDGSNVEKKKKPKYKLNGFEPKCFPPDRPYTNSPWKAIAGPKSQTSKTVVTFLKSFKNYLFVTFSDCSVRRYDIDDRNNVLKYEGHEGYVVRALEIIENPFKNNSFILFTGCYDAKVRCFDLMTGKLINSINTYEEVYCLEYCYSHLFVGTSNGNLLKVSLNNKPDTDSLEMSFVDKFKVNAGKKVVAIKAVNAMKVDSDSTDLEAILIVTNNKVRVIDTKELVRDEDRILVSTNFNFNLPVLIQTYKQYLCLSYKMPAVKSEDKKSFITDSKLLFFDMQKNWKPIHEIQLKNAIITALEVNKNRLICSTHSGEIRCIDIDSLALKWFAYHKNKLTATVLIDDRLVLGNEEGLIDVLYLDGKPLQCDRCHIHCARQIDLKEHIKKEHSIE